MLTWMTEKPTNPGYYWFRSADRGGHIELVEVFNDGDCECLEIKRRLELANLPGEWAGPIEPPEDATTLYAGGAKLEPGGMLYLDDQRDRLFINFLQNFPVEVFATPQHHAALKDVREQFVRAVKKGLHNNKEWSREEILPPEA